MSAQETALILGSTGQVGGALLKELLASSTFTRIGEFGRRNTSLDALPAAGKDKLEQKVLDFEKLEAAGLREGKWDVVFIALGTTAKAAGSSEAFERIDREYVINAARAAKSEGHPQRLVYVSVGVADPKSYFLYPRSKGLTEEGLAGLGYEDTIVFRPGMLAGTNRTESRPRESIAVFVSGLASRFSSSLQIKIGPLAKSLIKAGELGSTGLPAEAKATQAGKDGARFTVISNAGALAISE
ncbi:hypothetical protein DFH08DRAFT_955241 [Mycena albidolilacea]|uniref:NAD(P)-binding domain-containing protein n=1 Tax=Mycena albidolilacea TaxID=1033008 RepID=A0AAD7EZA0_9AGAR|nr:hypothetical protein DFH08DRAFT_955241 [Mycena albidolilacea]